MWGEQYKNLKERIFLFIENSQQGQKRISKVDSAEHRPNLGRSFSKK